MSVNDRHLRGAMGKRVRCLLDKPDRTEHGVLVEVRESGPRVQLDSGKTRTIAAWRISTLKATPGNEQVEPVEPEPQIDPAWADEIHAEIDARHEQMNG